MKDDHAVIDNSEQTEEYDQETSIFLQDSMVGRLLARDCINVLKASEKCGYGTTLQRYMEIVDTYSEATKISFFSIWEGAARHAPNTGKLDTVIKNVKYQGG